MELEFYGAAREVTGSCHILRANGRTLLLDCGMFQGKRSESAAKNAAFPLAIGEISAVVVSHAHIDHSGRLPFLVRSGYTGPIFATAATRDLCAVMLADSARIQESDARFLAKRNKGFVEPLYDTGDAVRTQTLMRGIPYGQRFDVTDGVRATYVDAGHILGSASVVLEVTEGGAARRLAYSGDIGRSAQAVIRDPVPPEGADVVIMESTYGNRDHEPVAGARARLAAVVRDTAARGGRVLIPAFAVGRTQELLYELHSLALEGAIPKIPIYVDSPLAIDTTTVFELHPEVFDRSEELVQRAEKLFSFDMVRFTRSAEESKALNTMRGPMVVISASGMMETGRILHHLQNGAGDPNNTILVAGFQAQGTLGRKIVEGARTIRVFGDDVPLRARVEVLNGFSAHADRTELGVWLDAVRATSPGLGTVYLVHGEPDAQDALKLQLAAKGYTVECPEPLSRRPL